MATTTQAACATTTTTTVEEEAQPVPVRAFLAEGPLKVTDLRDTFPLADLIGTTEEEGPNATRLQAIDAAHYPNPECIKPYAPAYKRYRGTVACGDEVRTDVPVFFKLTSVLDPNSLVAGKYHHHSATTAATVAAAASSATNSVESVQGNTPPPTTRARHQKERFAQNTAYTDSVASYLTSKLVEDGTCPHFPRVYGVYTGKAKRHYVEFTEEYYDHRRHTVFREGVRDAQWRMVPQPGPASDSGSDGDVGDDLLGSLGLGGDGDEPDFGTFMKQLAAQGMRGEGEEGGDSEAEEEEESDSGGDVEAMLQTLQGALGGGGGGAEGDETKGDEDDASSGGSSVLTNDSERIVDVDTCTAVALDELESIPVGDEPGAVGVGEEGASGGVGAECTGQAAGLTALDGFADLAVSETNLLMDGDFLTHLDTVDAPLAATGSHGYDDQPLYLEMADVPVQVVAMEAFDHVMEDHLRTDFAEVRRCELLVAREEGGAVTANVCAYRWLLRWRTRAMERKWTALLCQICMALVVMQHRYQMVHNDLHAQNVLLEETAHTHLLYRVDGVYYRVPTYGYVVKIIDMGRTTYQLRNTVYMPDVFQPKGEAGEQYTYIHARASGCGTGTEGEADVAPNPAFDLSRLACSLIDEFYGGADPYTPNMRGVAIPEDLPGLDGESKDDWLFEGQKRTVSSLYNLLCEWIADCYHEPVNRYENFDLYKKIARQMHGTLPIAQLRRPHFAQYTTTDNTVRTDEAFYDLTAVASEAFAPKMHTDGYHSDSEVPTTKAQLGGGARDDSMFGLWSDDSDSGSDDGDNSDNSPRFGGSCVPALSARMGVGAGAGAKTDDEDSCAALFAALLDPNAAGSGKGAMVGGTVTTSRASGSRRRVWTDPAQTF